MMSSRLVAVQCEAAALLVELSAVPQVLEVQYSTVQNSKETFIIIQLHEVK